jgi:uroporphyrinogen decarboxylase
VKPHLKPWQKAGVNYTDPWGCEWSTSDDGIVGTAVRSPLATWDGFEDYTPPDPEFCSGFEKIDWKKVKENIAKTRREGRLAEGGLRHGHTFLWLTYVHGYENTICDMAEGEPRLRTLIRMIEEFNLYLVKKYVEYGVEYMEYPDDLGMQEGPMVTPQHFREYIKPVYERLMSPAREAGCVIHMHSDGDIRVLVEDLIESGVDVFNLQDLVNGIDWIRDNLKGRVCIDLDLDRQKVTPFGTPPGIDSLVHEEVEKLGSRDGGLMMVYGLYPGVPLKNVKAIMDAMERYEGHYV